MEKVSIIMGIYNCEDTLDEAIQSIINQTYTNWELIMCDDGSTDETFKIAKKFECENPEQIKLIKNEKNLKLAATLNHCLKYVTGAYIARMDADDISLPLRLERQVDFLKDHSEYDLVGTPMISFDEEGDIGIKRIFSNPNKFIFRYDVPFAHATILARKNVYESLNGYTVSKDITRCEDVDLWFRFFAKGFKGCNLEEPLYKVRDSGDAFKRRTLHHGIKTSKVLLKGYKMLNYPKKYYVFILKPVIASLIPSQFMKLIHSHRDKKRKNIHQLN